MSLGTMCPWSGLVWGPAGRPTRQIIYIREMLFRGPDLHASFSAAIGAPGPLRDRVSCSNEAYPVFLGLPGILADPDISGVYLGRPDCLMKICILGLCKRVRKRLRNHPGACEHNRPEVGSNVDGFSRPPSPPSPPIPAILSQKLLRRATV